MLLSLTAHLNVTLLPSDSYTYSLMLPITVGALSWYLLPFEMLMILSLRAPIPQVILNKKIIAVISKITFMELRAYDMPSREKDVKNSFAVACI